MHDASVRRGAMALLCGLLILPMTLIAATSRLPLGTLRSEGAVFLGGDSVGAQSTLYPGDEVRTAEGRATVTFGRGTAMALDKDSSAIVRRTDQDLSISLGKGQFAISFQGQQPSHVDADGLILSPTAAFPALAEIAMKGDGTLVVAVRRGKISISDLRAEPVVVEAGQVITVNPRVAQTGQSTPIGTGSHAKMTLGEKLRTFHIGSLSHGASVAIVGGTLAGATTAAIVVPLTVGTEKSSPSVP